MLDWRSHRRLGSTRLSVTGVCFGTSPLGSVPDLYGYAVDEDRAVATIRAVFDSSINFLDTSNNYGAGRAESRIGVALRQGAAPSGFVIATKVDANSETHDFSGDRVRRSFEESLERLGLDRVELLHLHDPEFHVDFKQAMKPGGAVEALVRLRDGGTVGHIGIATGTIAVVTSYAETGAFDVVLNHNRYTLVDRSAESLMELCANRKIGFINGAPYGGGILARGSAASSKYGYATAHPEVMRAVQAMEAACARYDVPLAAAALQFSLRTEIVGSTVVGVSSPSRLEETAALADAVIPPELWRELETLVPPRETWLSWRAAYDFGRAEPATVRLADQVLAPAGIVPLIADMPAGVEATIRESNDRRLLFILNTLGEPAIVNGVPAGMDFLSGVELSGGKLALPAYGCCIIELD